MSNNEPEVVLNKYMIMPTIYFKELSNKQIDGSYLTPIFIKATLDVGRNSQLVTTSGPLEIREDVAKNIE
ncbi:MAG: hypothetical protein KBT36_13660 [Kurthia sp.]|nr:hypothetical protein [Candidatus Kurthia equi]